MTPRAQLRVHRAPWLLGVVAATIAPVVSVAGSPVTAGTPDTAPALNKEAELADWLDGLVQRSKRIVGVTGFVVAGAGPAVTAVAGAARLTRAWDKTSKAVVKTAVELPVGPATRFMLASTSKTVVWTALTMLLDAGKFGLDDAIDRALPADFPGGGRNPKYPSVPVTYRHLYTHTSGIIDRWDGYRYGAGCPTDRPYPSTLKSAVGAVVGKSKNWHQNKPGAKFRYSNYATALAALLVERHSGLDFTVFSIRHIFEPLGMASTSWVRPGAEIAEMYKTKSRAAHGTEHDTWAGGYCFADWPSGQLYSTATDLAKFAEAMLGYGRVPGRPGVCLYSEAFGRLAFEPAASTGDGDSALGWFAGGSGYPGGVGHDGAESGVAADIFIKTKSGVAVGWAANGELSDSEYTELTAGLIARAEQIGSRPAATNAAGGESCAAVLSLDADGGDNSGIDDGEGPGSVDDAGCAPVLMKTGSCPAATHVHIFSLSACESMAEELDSVAGTTARKVWQKRQPRGCFVKKGKLFFNRTGRERPLHKARRSVCLPQGCERRQRMM